MCIRDRFWTHLRLLVRCLRIVGPPEIPRSPSYPGGPSTGPYALAGSAVLLVMARTWPGPDLDPQNGQFWGPKWSILAIFGIKLGPKLVILGSKMGHFGGPNSSEEPRNTLFGGRLPSEYAHLGHLGPFGHMGRKWGILPLFSPF